MQFNPLWRASGLATEANKPTAVIIFGLNAANLAGVNVWHHPFPIISTYCCTNDQGGNRDNDSLFTCSKDPQIAIWKNGQLLHLQFSQVYVCFQQLAWLSMCEDSGKDCKEFFSEAKFCQHVDKGGGHRGWNFRFLWQYEIAGQECTPRLGWEEHRDLEKLSGVCAPTRK